MRELIAIMSLAALLALAGCASKQTASSVTSSSGSAAAVSMSSQSVESSAAASASIQSVESVASDTKAESADSIVVEVGETRLTMELADTDAARALAEHLQAGPITVSLHAYGGFEKVGPLPWDLPTSDEQITAQPGDVMLYQGNQITIFTGSNSWAYTPLGHIEGATSTSLLEAFGDDDVEAVLSLQ